jgi:hypothetical protein
MQAHKEAQLAEETLAPINANEVTKLHEEDLAEEVIALVKAGKTTGRAAKKTTKKTGRAAKKTAAPASAPQVEKEDKGPLAPVGDKKVTKRAAAPRKTYQRVTRATRSNTMLTDQLSPGKPYLSCKSSVSCPPRPLA